jgi:3-methylcrotonyl-CoA carboxylase alpha subunit
MFTKILIANRGEIACRIMRTAQQLGIHCVAVYSEADRHAQHVKQADSAYCIGPAASQQSYLQGEKILTLARKLQVEAIHPGYGFLSENADFAEQCQHSGIIFIGPSAEAIRVMGDKSAAKALMEKAHVPVTPGYHGVAQDVKSLEQAAKKIGYPILIKASAGGGGKGMRLVENGSALISAIAQAQREAQSSFGDNRILLEKYLCHTRHIEIQILADKHGHCVHLFERDCSIQRRHQKIIEQAPAPHFSEELRKAMGEAAIQVRVAANEPLTFQESQTVPVLHAIEARIYAEDPQHDFLPAIGTIQHLILSKDPHFRIDSGVVEKDFVSPYYDPMIAKLIAWDLTREGAVIQLKRALEQWKMVGVKNNVAYLSSIVKHPEFIAGNITTQFIPEHHAELLLSLNADQESMIALAAYYRLHQQRQATPQSNDPYSPWGIYDAWNLSGSYQETLHLAVAEQEISMTITRENEIYTFLIGENPYTIEGTIHLDGRIEGFLNQQWIDAQILLDDNNSLHVFYQGNNIKVDRIDPWKAYERMDRSTGHLSAPMPGTIVAVMAEDGQRVESGDSLLIIEAMKMEHTILAPSAGIVKTIHFAQGDQVEEGVELVAFEALPE